MNDAVRNTSTPADSEWDAFDSQQQQYRLDSAAKASKKGAAYRDYSDAFILAGDLAKEAGLQGVHLSDGRLLYSQQQAIRAACHSREDIVATAILQLKVLKRLDRNRNFRLSGLLGGKG